MKIVNNQIQSIERKEFDKLSSVKASFYAQKAICSMSAWNMSARNMSVEKMIQGNGNIEVLKNVKSPFPRDDVIDAQLQTDNIKRLEH